MNGDGILNDCGCCKGLAPATPQPRDNPPGLDSLSYRVGTQARFKASMLSAMGRQPALDGLTTRADSDPAVAIVDAYATALDVLSFYNERYADEGYLRTARERRSVLELARAIGYELAPGVGASTWLAFGCEETPGAPEKVQVETGTRAQSVPAQDELPQVFETIESIEARPAWNAMRPQTTARLRPAPGDTWLLLEGLATNLRQGDPILFVHSHEGNDLQWELRRVLSVEPDNAAGKTLVRWAVGLDGRASPDTRLYALRTRAYLFGHNAPPADALLGIHRIYSGAGIISLSSMERSAPRAIAEGPELSAEMVTAEIALPDHFFASNTTHINLDNVYSQVVEDDPAARSYAVLVRPGQASAFTIEGVTEESVADFNMSAKTTRLELSAAVPTSYNLRNTTVFCQSQELAIAETPLPTALPRNGITLDRTIDGLYAGQRLAFTGITLQPDGTPGEPAVQVVSIKALGSEGGRSHLTLEPDLDWDFVRASVRINGNVAAATHGETRTEVLGSGDASAGLQSFVLKQTPLTYVRAANAAGAASTLSVRVNDLLWDEIPALYTATPGDTVYELRLDDDGKARITFGDGERGRRLPTGVENVEATYRVGTGLAGLVKAGQISLLLSRPLGLRDVINPLAPAGAEDPESIDQARRNAPLRVMTLDRVVSLADFENFARSFAGVAKARARWLWNGERRMVHVTLAGPLAAAIEPDSELAAALRAALDAARHPDIELRLGSLDLRRFALHAGLAVDRRYRREQVEESVRLRLQEVYGFDRAEFGQGVAASAVIAAIQGVPGVLAVDLDALYLLPAVAPGLSTQLPALPARWSGTTLEPDQLVVIDEDEIYLTEIAA